MFPTPATRRWSSRNALIGARRPREAAAAGRGEAAVERLDAAGARRGTRRARRRRARARRSRSAAGRRSAARGRRRARESPAGSGCPGGRRSSSVPGHPQVHEQVDVVLQPPRSGTCRVAAARSTRRAPRPRRAARRGSQRLGTSAGRAISSARAAPLDDRRELAADRLDLGQLGHGVAASAGHERRAGQRGGVAAGQPAQHARADVGQRAVVAPAAVRRRSAPAAARARGCGRWRASRVAAVVGGEHEQVARRAARSSHSPTAASISRSARVEALDVLAVAVDLVGLDEVREDEAARRARRAAASSSRSAARVRRAGVLAVDAAAARTGRRPCRRRGRRRRARPARRGSGGRAAGARSRGGPSVRANAPGCAANGRAITRPTACSPVITSRSGAQTACSSSSPAATSSCAAICRTRVLRRVEDQLARRAVVRAEVARSRRCRR